MTDQLFECLPRVACEIQGGAHLLLCLDFDGTLAPIVTNPANARMPEATRAVLEALAHRPATSLAIVSGRALADLRSRVGVGAVILAGNHGLEIAGAGDGWRHPEAVQWQPALAEICRDLRSRTVAIPAAFVEDKGLTASVHYRNVAPSDHQKLLGLVWGAVAPNLDHFLLRRGRKVLEILPRVSWDKGSAVLWILERLRETGRPDVVVGYVGDDLTDEFAFRKLPGAITIRVGRDSPTAARFRVRDVAQVRQFLNWLRDPGLPGFQPEPDRRSLVY